jgi:GH24 family phage-related lysozyme (muramidase)/tRNA A-37 threonylcarbamoyl transferase component Bud32
MYCATLHTHRYRKMEVGIISASIQFDEQSIDASIKRLEDKAKRIKIEICPEICKDAFQNLSQSVQRYTRQIESQPIAIHFDDRPLQAFERSIKNLTKQFEAQQLALNLKVNTRKEDIDLLHLLNESSNQNRTITLRMREASNTRTGYQSQSQELVVKELRNVERAIRSTNKKGVLGTILTGSLETVGETFTKSLFKGLKSDLGVDVMGIARPVTKHIAKPLSKVTPENVQIFEDGVVDSLEQLFIFKNTGEFKARLKSTLKPGIDELKESALEAIQGVIYAGAQPLRIRKRVMLADSARQAESQAKKIPELSKTEKEKAEKAESILLTTGGIDFSPGGTNTYFAENLVKRIVPNAYSKAVTNPWSNDKSSLGKLFKLMSIGLKEDIKIVKGIPSNFAINNETFLKSLEQNKQNLGITPINSDVKGLLNNFEFSKVSDLKQLNIPGQYDKGKYQSIVKARFKQLNEALRDIGLEILDSATTDVLGSGYNATAFGTATTAYKSVNEKEAKNLLSLQALPEAPRVQALNSNMLAMERIKGVDVRQTLISKDVSKESKADIIQKAGLTLARLQSSGFTHNDYDPSNIMLSSEGNIRLIDLATVSRNDSPKAQTKDLKLAISRFTSEFYRKLSGLTRDEIEEQFITGYKSLEAETAKKLKQQSEEYLKKIETGTEVKSARLATGQREPMPLDRLLQVAVETGQNPDSIKLASEAIKMRQQFPDKPINLAGTSGGSYVVEEALAILQRAGFGENIKGIGLTAPLAGLTGTAKSGSFSSIVGDLDPLFLAMFGGKHVNPESKTRDAFKKTMEGLPMSLPGLLRQSPTNKVIPGQGVGHALLHFIGAEGTQQQVAESLQTHLASKELRGRAGIGNLDVYRKIGEENRTIPRTLKAIFGDSKVLRKIESENFGGGEGYTFAVPQKLDWRRDNDFKAMLSGVREMSKKARGADTKQALEDYIAFLEEIELGISEYLDTGGIVKAKLIGSLAKATDFYPELAETQGKIIKQAEEYINILNLQKSGELNKLPVREKQQTLKRLTRLEQQGFSTEQLTDNSIFSEVAEPLLKIKQFQESISSIKSNVANFQDAYAGIKQSLDKRRKAYNPTLATGTAKLTLENVERAKGDIETTRSNLGIERIGTTEANTINQLLSQLSQVEKNIKLAFAKAKIELPEISVQRYTLDEVGEDIVKGVELGIQQELQTLENAASEIGESVIEQVKDDFQIQSPSKVMQAIGQNIIEGLENGIAGFDIKKTFSQILDVGKIGAIFTIGIGLIRQYGEQAKQVAQEFEQIEAKFNFATGGILQAKDGLQFVREESNRLGISFRDAADAYGNLAASTRNSPLEGFATKQLFTGVQEAAAVRQLSQQDLEGVNRAIQQIKDKGNVQREEIVGQLGERLSGSLQLAARSRGQTVGEFSRDTRLGLVSSDEFLPGFGQALSAEASLALPNAMNSSIAVTNRFQNQIEQLQATLGKPLLLIQNTGLQALTVIIDGLNKSLPLLSNMLGVVLLQSLLRLREPLIAIGKSFLEFGGTNTRGILTGLGNISLAFGKLALKAAALMALVEALQALQRALSSASGELGTFANSSEDGLKRYRDIKNESVQRYTQPNFVKDSQSNFLVDQNSKELVLPESAIGQGLLGWLPDRLKATDEGIKVWAFGLRGVLQDAEKLFGDYALKAKDDRLGDAKRIVEASKATNEEIGNAISGDFIKEQARIKKELTDLGNKRRAIAITNPEDETSLRKIREQEEILIKQQERISKPTLVLSQQNNNVIEVLKKSIAEFDRLAAIPSEYQAEYRKQADDLRNSLEQAEKAQSNLNKSIRQGLTNFTLFAQRVDKLSDSFKDLQSRNQRFSQGLGALVNQYPDELVSGEQQASIKQQLEIQLKTNELSQLQTTLTELRTLINEQGTTLQPYGVNSNTGIAEAQRVLEQINNDPSAGNAKLVLEKFIEYRQLEQQLPQLASEVTQAQSDFTRSVRDSAKAVKDYYRELTNTSEQLVIETRQLENSNAVTNAKSKLKQALVGNRDSFVSQYVEGLVGIIEQLNQPLQNALEAQKQLVQQQQQQVQQQLQIRDLRRAAPISVNGQLELPQNQNTVQRYTGQPITGAIASPSTTASLNQIINTQLPTGRGFFGRRSGGRQHRKLDYANESGLQGHAEFNAIFPGDVVTKRVWGASAKDRMGGEESNALRIATPLSDGSKFFTDYGHVEIPNLKVKEGERVNAGQRLGRLSGNDTFSQGGHLDLGILVPSKLAQQFKTKAPDSKMQGYSYVDPREFMKWYQQTQVGKVKGFAGQISNQNTVQRYTPNTNNGAVSFVQNSRSSHEHWGNHNGDDIFAPIGSKIYSPVAGKVVQSREGGTKNTDDANPLAPGYQPQQLVIIKLDMPIEFEGKKITHLNMRHLLDRNVKIGQKVEIGDLIGTVGEAGGKGSQFGSKNPGTPADADAAHLHLEYAPSENNQRNSLPDSSASRLTQQLSDRMKKSSNQNTVQRYTPESTNIVQRYTPTMGNPYGGKHGIPGNVSNITDFIKHFENFSPNAYSDYGHYSIGYGTPAKSPNERGLSREEADKRLRQRFAQMRQTVLNETGRNDLNENQINALTSLVYNAGSLKKYPKLLGNVKKGNWQGAANEFLDINKAGGGVLDGLSRRRRAESELFMSPVSGSQTVQRYTPTSNIPVSANSPQTNIGYSYNNTQELELANQQVIANTQQQSNNIRAKLAADNQLAVLEAKISETKLKNQFEDGLKDAEVQAQQASRRINDSAQSIGFDTPQKQRDIQIRDINREFVDSTRDLTKQLSELQSARNTLRATRDIIKGGGFPQLQNQLPQIEDGLKRLDTSITAVTGALGSTSKLRTAKLQDVAAKFTIEETKRNREFDATQKRGEITRLRGEADRVEVLQGGNLGELRFGDPIKLRKQAQELETLTNLDEQLAQLEELQRTGQRTTEQISALREQYELLAGQELENTNIKSERDIRERLLKIEAQDLGLQGKAIEYEQQRIDLLARRSELKLQLFPNDLSIESPNAMRLQSQLQSGDFELKKLINETKQFAFEQGYSNEETEQLINNVKELDSLRLDNLRREIQNGLVERMRQVSEQRFEISKRLSESDTSVKQAQIEVGQQYGVQRYTLQKEVALEQQNQAFLDGMKAINDYAKSVNLSADAVERLQDNLRQTNELKLDGIRAQFDPFQQVISSSFSGMQQGLEGLFNGTMTFGDAWVNFTNTVGNTLSKLAAEWLTNEFVTNILGIGKSKSGLGSLLSTEDSGGLGDLWGGGLSLLGGLLGFKTGGEIGDYNHQGYRDLPVIGDALKKEGNNAVLIAATPGEQVLNTTEAKFYRKMFPSGIKGHRMGGSVDGLSSLGNMTKKNVTNNVGINISSSGGNENVDIDALRMVVIAELSRQQELGGILSDIR